MELQKGTNVWRVAEKITGKTKCSELPLIVDGRRLESDLEKAELMNSHLYLYL